MNALQSYTAVSHQSASPEQLIILLYERAIKGQIIAIDRLEEGDRKGASSELRRCREIFIELASALDHVVAPELSGNLHQLYMWTIRELLQVSQSGDPAALEHTLDMSQTLYEALREVL